MAWYAYCITEQSTFQSGRVRRPFAIEQLHGLEGKPVFGYPSGEFVVVVTAHDSDSQFTQQSVKEHARVISDCFKLSTVLPFRFGTIFESAEALRLAVRTNKRAFSEALARLKGKAEMHLKLVVRDEAMAEAVLAAAMPTARVGGEYLTRLRAQATRDRERQSKARALSVQANRLFHPLQEEIVCKKVGEEMLIDIAHLIDSESIEKYQNRYTTAMRQFKDCQISLSGPWPPFHFMPGKIRTVNQN
jgi:Gas vesicle synthesis protein GvpL/GvpF